MIDIGLETLEIFHLNIQNTSYQKILINRKKLVNLTLNELVLNFAKDKHFIVFEREGKVWEEEKEEDEIGETE